MLTFYIFQSQKHRLVVCVSGPVVYLFWFEIYMKCQFPKFWNYAFLELRYWVFCNSCISWFLNSHIQWVQDTKLIMHIPKGQVYMGCSKFSGAHQKQFLLAPVNNSYFTVYCIKVAKWILTFFFQVYWEEKNYARVQWSI